MKLGELGKEVQKQGCILAIQVKQKWLRKRILGRVAGTI